MVHCRFVNMIDFRNYPIPRVRHHVNPQVYLPASQYQGDVRWYPPTIDQADWKTWFHNGLPARVLDIGCGRGGFLLDHALAYPDVNILGLEVRGILVDWTNGVINGERIPNARALWYSVANGLQWIADHSIDYAVYLFPDPWPKRRHHKRRAFVPGFLDELNRVLTPNGRLYLATDRPDVDEYQREVIAEHGIFTVHDLTPEEWPFAFTTDQQRFCHRKNIPYTLAYAAR